MLLSEFEDRDVAILGAGREGRSAYRWLRRRYPDLSLTVYDERAVDWPEDANLRRVVGPLDGDRLRAHEVLVRSPGISPYRPALQAALAAGVTCTSASSLWFAAHPEAKTLCITGTKGKSTTASLTAHLLRHAGERAQLAGNIGTPLLDCDEDVDTWWVIELSSYQLADLEARPTAAAILNLSDEHLDWHGDAAAYRRDKLRLAELAGSAPLVLNHRDPLLRARFSGRKNVHWFGHDAGWHGQDAAIWLGERKIAGMPRGVLPGAHNLDNLAAALTLLQSVGITVPDLTLALESFRGLPHRLQRLGSAGGVEYVNDSLATTPVATLAALEAFRECEVILLVGGLDRGLDWSTAIDAMRAACPAAVICLPDSGAAIAAAMAARGLAPARGIHVVVDLEAGMACAKGLAGTGDLVLLSPGAPSFPRFRDYAERGLRFAQLAGFDIESL